MSKIKRAVAMAGAAALTAGLTMLGTGTASAAVVEDANGFVDTKTLVDDGGVPYVVSVDWNKLYRDAAGTLRASVNPLVVKRTDASVIAAGEPEDAGLDIHWDVINPSGYFNQHKNLNNVDLDFAADNVATFNPRNPKAHGAGAVIRVRVGTDGDGLGSSDWAYFRQSAGTVILPVA